MSVEREPCLRSTSRVAGTGPIPISVGSTPTMAQCVRRASGVMPCVADRGLRGEQQRGAAVDDAGGVAGGDAAVLAEGGGELRQPLERRIRAHVVVLRRTPPRPLRDVISTGTTSSRSRPASPGGVRQLLAAKRVLGPAPRARSRRSRRSSPPSPPSCSRSACRAGQKTMSPRAGPVRAEPAAHAADDVRRLAHALHPAGEDESASPRRIICAPLMAAWMPEPHRRLTVSAGTSTGTPALSADVSRAVDGVGAGLQHVAENDVVDCGRRDARSLDRAARGDGAELDARKSLSACRCSPPSASAHRQE